MFEKSLVSVIIPNYNHAPFLKQRINSVLNQTFQDFELIILDDCSTDRSEEIIEEYRNHPKISQIIFNRENSGGVFKQWIKGIENAKGKYIWIAESDDYSAPDFLQETVNFLEADDSLGMVFTNTTTVDRDGKILTTTSESKSETYRKLQSFGNTINAENLALFLISEMIIENAGCVLFRKSALTSLDFTELSQYRNTGDRFAYIGIALQHKIRYLPKALNFMRFHGDNTTQKNVENGNIHRDRLRVLNYYFDQIQKSSAFPDAIAEFYKENYFHFINHCTADDNLQLLKNVKKTGRVSGLFYVLVKNYIVLFKKKEVKSKLLRGIYYRILLKLN